MTDLTAQDPRVAAPALRVGARLREATASDAVMLGAVGVFTLVLLALTWGRWGDLTMDTGYDLLAAARTAHGELPYVDYVYFYGPTGPLLLGGIYAITGAAVWPAIAVGLVLSVAAIYLTYRLARVFVAPLPAALAAALVSAATMSSANNSYALPHSTSAPLSIVLALGALLALSSWMRDGGGNGRLLTAGALCGGVAITRLELAIALYGAVALWLLVRIWHARGERRGAWADALRVAAPAVAIPIVVYGAFVAAGVSVHDLLWNNLYPRDFVRAAGHVVLDAHAPMTAGSVAKLVARLVVYAAGAAGLVVLAHAVERGGRVRLFVLGAAAFGVVAFLAVLAGRPDTVRFYLKWAYGWIPAGAWLAVAVLVWRSRKAEHRGAVDQTALLLVLFLGAATANTYAQFNPFPNASFPEATPYVLPLVAVFFAWLHVRVLGVGLPAGRALGTLWLAILAMASAGLIVHDARSETAVVHGPGGSLHAHPAEAGALQGALDAIARNTRPGDQVLFAPQLSALYVMSDRRDPLPQLSLLPGALPTPRAEQDAIARMNEVRLVVTDTTPLRTYAQGPFGTTYDRGIAAWLRRDFRLAERVRGTGADARALDIWIRRST